MAKTLGFMFAFALPILLTRSLSQNEYGLFKQVFLIASTAVSLLPLGFGMSAYYYLPRESDPARRGQVIFNILLFNLLMGAAACLALIVWPEIMDRIFRDPGVLPTPARRFRDRLLVVFGVPGSCRRREPGVATRDDLYRRGPTQPDGSVVRRGVHL